ncbi:MAG: tetratricopeptide repeat protein [bacterium]|nr:tetratricopeptide repeat protein [bacterium]
METSGLSASELLELADTAFQKREIDSALATYTKAGETARAEFNRPVEVEALCQVARCYLTLGSRTDGEMILTEAAAKASENDPLGWSRYLGVRGRFEWKGKDLDAARKTFEDYYTFCALHDLRARAIDAVNMSGIVAASPQEAIDWTKRGIEMAESYEAEHWLGPLWNNLGGTYYDLKRFDDALDCYLKAREYHWRHSTETAKLFADYHVGMTYRLTGQNETAKSWLRPVLAWAERLGNHSAIAQVLDDLGEIAKDEGNLTEALALLKRAKDHFRLDGYPEHSPDIWENVSIRVAQLEAKIR